MKEVLRFRPHCRWRTWNAPGPCRVGKELADVINHVSPRSSSCRSCLEVRGYCLNGRLALLAVHFNATSLFGISSGHCIENLAGVQARTTGHEQPNGKQAHPTGSVHKAKQTVTVPVGTHDGVDAWLWSDEDEHPRDKLKTGTTELATRSASRQNPNVHGLGRAQRRRDAGR